MIISAGLGRDSDIGCNFRLHPNGREFYLELTDGINQVELSQKEFLLLEKQIRMIREEFVND